MGEYRYNGCCDQLEWQRDAAGRTVRCLRDAEGRVTDRIESWPGREDIVTRYLYDFEGNVLEERVETGEIVQVTTSTYDPRGRLVSRTDPGGLVTRYEYDEAGRRTVTLLPGNATRVEDRYLDGRVKAVHGTSVVAQYYDYHSGQATFLDVR